MIANLSKILQFNRENIQYLCLGLLSILAFAPFNLFFTFFIIIPILFDRLRKCKKFSETIRLAIFFGFGYYLSNYYWISFSFIVEKSHILAFPIVFLFIPFFFTIYFIIYFCLFHYIQRKFKINLYEQLIIFVVLWILIEYLRGHSILFFDFTGLPWNLIGYSFFLKSEFVQIAYFVGIYGLSTILIASSASFYIILRKYQNKEKIKNTALTIISINLAIYSSIYLFGMHRLNNKNEGQHNFTIKIINPAIDKHHNYKMENIIANIDKQIAISKDPLQKEIDLLIWPESSIALLLNQNNESLKYIFSKIKNVRYLFAGSFSAEGQKYFNTGYLIDKEGNIIDYYRKANLVPFGEYIPLISFLPIKAITNNIANFYPGKITNKIIKIDDNISFTPLICYDAIFTGRFNNNSDFLVNITNDIWFSKKLFGRQISTGLYQHSNIVRLRAIEEGMPMIRVANNGLTSIFDSYGSIIKQIKPNQAGAISSLVPVKLEKSYARLAKIIIFYILISLLFLILIKNRSKQS
jgi:apolipoprotein N-acyltransferase